MADSRTFVLIGDFQDNITPALEGINNTINSFKRNMATMTSKRGGGFSDVTQSVGKLVSAQKHLANSIKDVGDAAKAATAELKEYRQAVGKVASAHYHIAKSSKQAGDKIASSYDRAVSGIDKVNRKEKLLYSARRQRERNLSSMGASAYSPTRRTATRTAPAPRMAGGGGGGGGGGRGHGVGYDGRFDMPVFAFGLTLGQGISQPITAAVLSGFQLGVGLLQQSFQYISGSFAERIQDQMTDLQAAGGYYSIAKRQKNPMFTSLQQSVIFTQRTNDVLERLAADLPGATEDYVKVSKRIGDSVMRLVDSNEKGSTAYAKELMAKGQLQESYRGVSLDGPNAREGAVQVILGELTKKTVLAGFGGQAGRGGAAGAYGLPALMERLITNPDTSMAQLQKYAAVFGDPKIMSALGRAMPELEKAGSDMLKRTMVINEMLDEISPPEMISAMRKSMAGLLEGYRSAFFSPGTGFLGFGRKLKDASGKLQPLTDVYGRFIKVVEKNGKAMDVVVKRAEDADQGYLDVFNMFTDILTNYGEILKPIVDNLYLIWDPLQGIADALRKARVISIEVLQTFRNYVAGLEKFAEGISDEGLKNAFLSTKSFRATLLTITNLFTQLGVFSEADFYKFQKKIIDPKTSMEGLGEVLKSLSETFFNSEAATEVGKFFGRILREVVIVLSGITDFGAMLGKSNLASGLVEGFGKKGFQALEKMFKNLYEMIFWAVGKAISAIPPSIIAKIAGYALAGSLVLAGIAGLGIAIGVGVARLFAMLAAGIGQKIASGSMLANCLSSIVGATCGDGGGGGGAGGGKGTQRNSQLQRRRKRMDSLFIAPGGAKAAANLRERGRSALQTSYAGPAGPLPPHSFYKGRRTQHMHPGFTPMGRMQQAARVPGRMYKRVGAAPIAPTLQALGGMFQGGKGGRALMAKMGRFVPGGALAFGGIDAAIRMSQGEDAGRAIGGAAASTIGATLGGILGQTLIPIPGVGAALGTVAGGILGDKIFNAVIPSAEEQKRAAQIQLEAANLQRATQLRNSGVDVEAAGGGAFNFGDFATVSKYLDTLGLSQDPAVKEFRGAYSINQQKIAAAAEAGEALNKEIMRLRDQLKLPPAEVHRQVKPLQEAYDNASKDAQETLTTLNTTYAKLNTETKNKISSSADNMAKAIDDGAKKIAEAAARAQIPPPPGQRPNTRPGTSGNRFLGNNWNQMNLNQWPAGVPLPGTPTNSGAFGSPGKSFSNLAAAANYETKHKPAGSKLVVANSSETVIPAAGGYGMKDFMGILSAGFTAINDQYKSLATGVNTLDQQTGQKFQQAETTNADRYQKTTTAINNYHKENQQEFAKIGENILQLSQKVATMSSMGGMFGGMELGGGYGAAGVQIAGQLGNYIKATGGAPGSIHEHPMHGGVKGRHAPNSYHYSGRAIDIGAYANEQAGVIARIKQFNAKYGVKPVEFLHAGNDPAGHSDHIHVAYALGQGKPAFFSNQKDAVSWEKKNLGTGIKSITTNSAELAQAGDGMMGPSWLPWNWGKLVDQERKTNPLNRTNRMLEQMQKEGYISPNSLYKGGTSSTGTGNPVNITAPITINQQPGQDPEQLAYMVAERIQAAVSDAVNASILV